MSYSKKSYIGSLRWALLLLPVLLFSSCNRLLFRNLMLRTDADYAYKEFEDIDDREYRLAPNDILIVRVFANDGFDMVNIAGFGRGTTNSQMGAAGMGAAGMGAAGMGAGGMGAGGMGAGGRMMMRGGGGGNLVLRVEFDGFVKMPVSGMVYLEGLTVRQAEMLLEDYYSEFINKPFVLVDVFDKRVFLFMGDQTQVVPLFRDNITLFEILAQVGGIPMDGKADKVKLIRGDLKNPDVHVIDLSTLKGVQNADLVMQANDIIYVEVRRRYAQRTVAELAPWLSLLTFSITTPLTIIALLRL